MMLSEFVERTGFEPMPAEYAKIEEAYCSFNGDKDAFCKAFVAGDGEKKIYQARAAEIDRLNGKILEMDKTFQQSSMSVGWPVSGPSLTRSWNGSPTSSARTSPRPNMRSWPSALIAGLPAT